MAHTAKPAIHVAARSLPLCLLSLLTKASAIYVATATGRPSRKPLKETLRTVKSYY
jgi:hypothetical protein